MTVLFWVDLRGWHNNLLTAVESILKFSFVFYEKCSNIGEITVIRDITIKKEPKIFLIKSGH